MSTWAWDLSPGMHRFFTHKVGALRERERELSNMEIPTIPKVVLDNLFASMGSPASFKEPTSIIKPSHGFRQMPVPLFHGASLQPPTTIVTAKSPASSLMTLSGGVHMKGLATSPSYLFKDCTYPSAKEGSGLPPVKEKPKRVRKPRAGALSNKRGTADMVLYTNLEEAQAPQLHPPKRRRLSAKSPHDGENMEKPPPRKRNRSKAKAKEEQSFFFSTSENSIDLSDLKSSKGMLGLYGMETKTLDMSSYMKDNLVENLSAVNIPCVSGKQGRPSNICFDNSFGSHASSILQNLARPVNLDQARLGLLFSKPAESRMLKFGLNLECSPLDGSQEDFCLGLLDPKIKASHNESFAPFLETKKVQEAPSGFPLETTPVIPSADFWNTLPIQPHVSLSSLIAQASATPCSQFLPWQARSTCEQSSTLPPIFSLGSSRIKQESSGDRLAISKVNEWFRAESPKWESEETQPHNFLAFSRGNTFPFKLDSGSDPLSKPTVRSGLKEGLFDIDLNIESPEAKAAESIAHSSSLGLSKPQVPIELPAFVQVKGDVGEEVEKSQSVQSTTCANDPTPMDKVEYTCNTMSLPDCQDSNHKLEELQQNHEVGVESASEESVSAIVNKQHGTAEQVKDVSINASSSLLQILSVPEMPETIEMCSADAPYSPGMQATAHILCKMANSSSPFYDDTDAQVIDYKDMQRPAKAIKVSCLVEKEARTWSSPALDELWSEEHTVKAHFKDEKDKLMVSHLSGSNGPTTEPWASTPPRHAPRSAATRMSGSQSSESERSPCHGRKVHSLHTDHKKCNKLQEDRCLEVATSSKAPSIVTRKDRKGNLKPVPRTSFLHSLPAKGLSDFIQKRSASVETKQFDTAYGNRLRKVSRPRSNTSKNCLQLQRSTNGYPVQSGCSSKSSNRWHVLP